MAVLEKRSPSRKAVCGRWKALYGDDPPAKVPKSLLVLAIAYRQQQEKHGGLRPALRRRLLDSLTVPKSVAHEPVKTGVGTILVREWHGERHTVTVLDRGIAYQGKLYRSLTQVAKVITGSHWSGPTFFGLKAKLGPRHD